MGSCCCLSMLFLPRLGATVASSERLARMATEKRGCAHFWRESKRLR